MEVYSIFGFFLCHESFSCIAKGGVMFVRFFSLILLAGLTNLTNQVAVHAEDVVLSFYVSPTGDDANLGTADKPFRTITKAQEAIRNTLLEKAGDKEVLLLPGEYVLTEPLRFGPEDGGVIEGAYHQVFYEGRDAVITGGKKITGFQPVENGIVVADIPEVGNGSWMFRDLYVNDSRATRARFPNEGFLHVEKAGEDRRTNFFFRQRELKQVPDLDQVELVFLHDWSITRTPVKSIDMEKSQLTVPFQIGGSHDFFAIDGFESHARYFLENSREYLDMPGEWFLDQKEGKLYYKLREGETAENIHVVAPVAKQLLVVEGTPEQPVVNLHFCNLEFKYTAFHEKSQKTYWGTQAACFTSPEPLEIPDQNGKNFDIEYHEPESAAVQWDYVKNCTIGNCSFRHLGENGLWIRKACEINLVQNCVFEDMGGNGVMIGTHTENDTAKLNVLSFCRISKPGQTLYGAVGIWVGLTQNTAIDRCEVCDSPYTGVSLGWAWHDSPTVAKENMVLGCHLHHNMQLLSDGGAIYTLGLQPGSRLAFNRIHDIPKNVGSAESNGMFLDEGTTDFTIDYNLITDTARSPLRFHRAGKNLVANNFFSLNPEKPSIVTYNNTPKENIVQENNTTGEKNRITEKFAETIRDKIIDYRTR